MGSVPGFPEKENMGSVPGFPEKIWGVSRVSPGFPLVCIDVALAVRY